MFRPLWWQLTGPEPNSEEQQKLRKAQKAKFHAVNTAECPIVESMPFPYPVMDTYIRELFPNAANSENPVNLQSLEKGK